MKHQNGVNSPQSPNAPTPSYRSWCFFLSFLLALISQTAVIGQTPQELGYVESAIPFAPTCGDYTLAIEVGSLAPGNNASATAAFPNNSDLTNLNILVSGTFTLNKSMNFNNCRVFFNPDASMRTSGTVNLVASGSFFGPCGENTWGGITINAEAAIQLQTCGIVGAINGLIFKAGYRAAESHLIENSFARNGNEILCTDVGATLTFTQFYLNHFLGAGFLPGTSIQPRTGIKVANCTSFIGTVFADPQDEFYGFYSLWSNEFRNFLFGIEANDSKVVVTNCAFYQIRPSLDAMGVPTGCGIRADNCTLYTRAGSFGGSTIGYCDFENCAFAGINATNSQTQISLAQFRGTQLFGITSTKTQKQFQRVSRCKMTLAYPTNKAGIAMERPGNIGTPTVWILLDTIDIVNPGLTAKISGIELRSPNVSTGNLAIIENNKLSRLGNTSVSFGIIVYGNTTNNYRINNNYCNAVNASISNFGIFLTDGSGKGHQVNNNHSVGDYTCNFHIQKFRNVGYCDNTCNAASNGFHFQGDNVGSVWSVNNLGQHDVGLNIEDITGSGGKIGPQTRKGNMWQANDNLYSAFAALCIGDASKSFFLLEKQNDKVVFPTKTQPANGWFEFQTGNLEYCSSGGDVVSDFDYQYAAGVFPSGYLSVPEGWEISRGLIKTLLQNPSAMTGNTILQYFYNQNLNTSAGKFAQAEALLESIPYLNTTQQTQLGVLLSQQETLADEIAVLIQSSVRPNIANGFYSGTNPTVDTKVQQWATVTADMETILNNAMPNFQTHLGNVLTSLQNITVSQPYEQGWKIVMLREVKDMMGATPTTSESSDMATLAYASQSTYGAAVRHAWPYMPPSERFTLVAPNENATNARGVVQESIASIKSSDMIRIQPNPASDEVLISLPKPMGGQWNLINATGNIVRSGVWQASESNMVMETSSLSIGLYFYVFRPLQGVPIAQKLIISR